MAEVTLENVWKIYDGNVVSVKDVSFTVNDHEFMVLVGPSGCGKSTTLRMISGLEEISRGTIKIGDRVVNGVAPKNRDIAMVFQNYALYPHMTVYDNMAFGLKLRHMPKNEIKARVDEAARILGLEEYLQRRPKHLSGGQRQRVAVGRAIVRQPAVFLFDEPLSNLDAKMRVQMRAEITRLHRTLNGTMIYVTHDQIEAMTMGDRICVMKDGVIQQIDEPLTIYERPCNMFVAGFIGTPPMNFFQGRIERLGDGYCFTESKLVFPLLAEWNEKVAPHLGRPVVLGLRPEGIGEERRNDRHAPVFLKATVDMVEPMGSELHLYCSTGDNTFVAKVDMSMRLKSGDAAELPVSISRAHLFDPDTGASILH